MSEATGSDPCHLTCWSPLTHSTQASRASFLSLNLPSTCPPRGLCAGRSLCLERTSPREPPGSHPPLRGLRSNVTLATLLLDGKVLPLCCPCVPGPRSTCRSRTVSLTHAVRGPPLPASMPANPTRTGACVRRGPAVSLAPGTVPAVMGTRYTGQSDQGGREGAGRPGGRFQGRRSTGGEFGACFAHGETESHSCHRARPVPPDLPVFREKPEARLLTSPTF